MRNRFPRTITSLLLTALVLATGIAPTTVRHAHEGGQIAHHRHEATAHDTHHVHGDHASHDHHHHGRSCIAGSQPTHVELLSADVRNFVLHLHGCFLGVPFSAPLPDGDSPGEEGSRSDSTLVRFPVSPPPTCLNRDGGPGRVPASWLQARVDAGCVQPASPCFVNLTRGGPLCDRARRERSGVLLV